jgi:8-oxo-dGTP pyrophosphatase MutT (NUDIX family)
MIISSLVLVKCNNKVLLCKRSLTQPSLAGYWSAPGGQVESGEDPVYTAFREFREETNLTLKNSLKKVDLIKNKNYLGKTNNKIHIFLYEVDNYIYPQLDFAVDGKEHSRCGYFDKDDLPEPISPELKKTIEKILK